MYMVWSGIETEKPVCDSSQEAYNLASQSNIHGQYGHNHFNITWMKDMQLWFDSEILYMEIIAPILFSPLLLSL